jgi:predicted MPP superfamily phosphohydrolase
MPDGAAVMICGHTHGGQLCLPGRRAVINMSTAPLRWSAGHIEEDGRHLYVSRGLGTSAFPFRSFAPPEVSVMTISGTSPVHHD